MASENHTTLFVFLIVFWTLLTMTTYVLQDYLTEDLSTSITDLSPNELSDIQENDKSVFEDFTDWAFNVLDEIPIINYFTPILKMLTFQYSDNLPTLLIIFLDMTFIFTAFVLFSMRKG